MTTLFSGTDLHEEYKPYLREGLRWDMHDGNHAVFEHEQYPQGRAFKEYARGREGNKI